eukprot:SAG31_NODE_3138_length_4632_cov_2.290315_3_plen_113_part_00
MMAPILGASINLKCVTSQPQTVHTRLAGDHPSVVSYVFVLVCLLYSGFGGQKENVGIHSRGDEFTTPFTGSKRGFFGGAPKPGLASRRCPGLSSQLSQKVSTLQLSGRALYS